MSELIRRSKLNYYSTMIIMFCCFLVMTITPMYVDDYLWQVMLLPIIIQLPTFLLARKMLIANKAI